MCYHSPFANLTQHYGIHNIQVIKMFCKVFIFIHNNTPNVYRKQGHQTNCLPFSWCQHHWNGNNATCWMLIMNRRGKTSWQHSIHSIITNKPILDNHVATSDLHIKRGAKDVTNNSWQMQWLLFIPLLENNQHINDNMNGDDAWMCQKQVILLFGLPYNKAIDIAATYVMLSLD